MEQAIAFGVLLLGLGMVFGWLRWLIWIPPVLYAVYLAFVLVFVWNRAGECLSCPEITAGFERSQGEQALLLTGLLALSWITNVGVFSVAWLIGLRLRQRWNAPTR